MQFRRAVEQEADTLSKVAFESKASWAYSTAQLSAWEEDLAVQARTIAAFPTYVVESEAEVLGFFVLIPMPGHWKLEHFWVLPAAMGRGIGRAMLKFALGIAAREGATALEIDADPNAEQFYLACGAVKVGSLVAPIEGLPDRTRPQMLLSIEQPNPSFKRTPGGAA